MTDHPEEPRVENLYQPPYRQRVRAQWSAALAKARWGVAHPGAAVHSIGPWLRTSLGHDRALARSLVQGTSAAAGTALRHPIWRRWILGAFALLGFLLTFSWERCGLMGCPNVGRLASLQPGGASVVYDARGNRLGRLAAVQWEVVKLDGLPEHVPEAFVAVEDQRFYRHNGVDWRRFLGVLVRNLKPGARGQGGSTITMQLARNVFSDRLSAADRTPRRKILEIRVAREIESALSKEEILQLYLNNIYFGEGVYGIESAARIYFGKRARNLSLPEAALLAGLPKAPSNYNPRRNLEKSLGRRNLVLSLMAAQGKIGAGEAAAAKASRPRLARWETERERQRAPYFMEQVRRVMEAEFGEELYSGSLRIHTTLDMRVQNAAEQNLERQIRRIESGAFGRYRGPRFAAVEAGAAETPYLQGSAIVLDAHTGNVRALVGGRSYQDSQFDRMMQGFRQPGSAFKPFVFATALEAGMAPTDRFPDEPLRRELPGGEVWEPRNFDGRFRGPITLRHAVRQSINTVAVLVAERVGLGEVAATARRLGISSDIARLPSAAIGASAVRPIELVGAYTAFATLGDRVEPRFVTRVEDEAGKTVWEPRPRRRDVLDAGVAFLITDMLRDVVDRGTGSRVRTAGFNGPAAGKTGTTNGATDAWFVGFTPRLVGAVWIGFDRGGTILASGSGGELAAPVWARMMRVAADGSPGGEWKKPRGVVERRVVRGTDRVVALGCRPRGESYEEFFIRGAIPPTVCPRGTPKVETGVRGWWNRQVEALREEAEEWLADAWAEIRREIPRLDPRTEERGDRPAPQRGDAPPEERTTEEPVSEERVSEPRDPVIADTIRLEPVEPVPIGEPAPARPTVPDRSPPRDTLVLPDPLPVEEVQPPPP